MTYIIAEVGSNWTNFHDAKDSIAMAKQCGADAVKFQLFTYEDMYGCTPTVADELKEKEFNKYALDPEWLPLLKEKADACEIDFMCTAFSPEDLKLVNVLGVKAHKIASSDMRYPQLLEAAKESGKPLYLSCGSHNFPSIKQALEFVDKDNTTLMYCSSEYPSTWHNLRLINVLRKHFSSNVGYSDHSIDIYTPVVAARLHGATIIEKHFKAKDEMDTPDSAHSLNPERFKYMVNLIHDPDSYMKMPNPGERHMIMRNNRRLIATRDIVEGEPLCYGINYGCYRSLKDDTHGWSGMDWKHVNGKEAKKAIGMGDSIGPGDI